MLDIDHIYNGDCLELIKSVDDNSIDAIITDPPYNLSTMKRYATGAPALSNRIGGNDGFQGVNKGFMGKEWDNDVAFHVEVWQQAYRILKPGGYLLSFGGDRTEHRMKCAIEDAGFEIRSTIAWIYGQGFPKSLNVSKKLNSIIPSNLRCVCDNHLMNKVKDFQDDYHPVDDLYDGQLLSGQDNAPNVFPLQDDVLEHNHDGRNKDVHDLEYKYNLGHLSYDLLSNEDCQLLYNHLLEDCPENDSKLYDILKSMLHDVLMAEHNRDCHISDKLHSDDDSVSLTYSLPPIDRISRIYHKCQVCNKYYATEGIGTALKPAVELICMARKPLSEKTVAENVLKYGTGGINIDECRVVTNDNPKGSGNRNGKGNTYQLKDWIAPNGGNGGNITPQSGRFPANLIHDGSDVVMAEFEKYGNSYSKGGGGFKSPCWSESIPENQKKDYGDYIGYLDSGTAARFFYCAKSSKSERDMGCEGLEEKQIRRLSGGQYPDNSGSLNSDKNGATSKNNHPTVKPIKLMEYLIKLVTTEKAIVLDPFAGSGSTLIACRNLGRNYIGIEKEADYVDIANKRIADFTRQLVLV